MIDLTTITDDELPATRVQVLTEQERRQRMADIPAQVAELAPAPTPTEIIPGGVFSCF